MHITAQYHAEAGEPYFNMTVNYIYKIDHRCFCYIFETGSNLYLVEPICKISSSTITLSITINYVLQSVSIQTIVLNVIILVVIMP